jgi:single-strand DNA-binding protein
MNGINKAHLIGSLAQEPQFSYTPAGLAVLDLTVASRLSVTAVAGTIMRNSYTRVKLFGTYAEILSTALTVGNVVEVFGRAGSQHVRDEQGRYTEYVYVLADQVVSLAGEFSFALDSKEQPVLLEGMNHIILGGNVARGVYRQTTEADNSYVRFTLAVDEAAQGRAERVNFLRVSAWGELAARAAQVSKGTPLVTSGRLLTDSYTMPDGERAYTTHLVAETLNLVEVASQGTREASAAVLAPAKVA